MLNQFSILFEREKKIFQISSSYKSFDFESTTLCLHFLPNYAPPYNTPVSTYRTSLACEINSGGRGRSAAKADNKFPNIIFSFAPVFSPRIIALLTSPFLLYILSFPPIFPFPFFSAGEHTITRESGARH